MTVSPFYHYNDSQYISGSGDPLSATNQNTSNYLGSQAELSNIHGPNHVTVGMYGFFQRNDLLFGRADPTAAQAMSAAPVGGVGAGYINNQYKPWNWLTISAGLRYTHFSGITNENALSPRGGVSVQLPKLHWVLRAFYGKYYQPPPLYTVGGGFAFGLPEQGTAGISFQPLKGERDIQREFGLTIPVRGWVLDFTHFSTSALNFLDHDVLGNSNILLPLTTPNARMFGTEVAVRSPLVMRRVRYHLAYSYMTAQYMGAPNGGLIEPVPEQCLYSFCYLDHDQRNTLSTGAQVELPHSSWFATNVVCGSGVLAGDGPDHLPSHVAADVMLGKSIGERWTFGITAMNISNSRYPFSVNNSFAGTHFNNPREIIGSVRYRFHF